MTGKQFKFFAIVFVLIFIINAKAQGVDQNEESKDGRGDSAILLTRKMESDYLNDPNWAISQYASSFVQGKNEVLYYTVEGNTNDPRPIPFPTGKEKEMVMEYLRTKANQSSPTSLTGSEIKRMASYSDMSEEELKKFNSFVQGPTAGNVDKIADISNPTLRALMINNTFGWQSDNVVSLQKIADLLDNQPNSVDGEMLKLNLINLENLNEHQRTNLMNAMTLSIDKMKEFSANVCSQTEAAFSALGMDNMKNEMQFDTAKRALINFSTLSDYGLDPNFFCSNGMSLGSQIVAVYEKALSSHALTNNQKNEIRNMIDKNRVLNQTTQFPNNEAFEKRDCQSLKQFFGDFELCDLSDILAYLHEQSKKSNYVSQQNKKQKNARHTFPKLKENDDHYSASLYSSNEPCTVKSMYQVNARIINGNPIKVIQNGKVIVTERSSGKDREFDLNGLSLEDYQKQIWDAYNEARNKRK